MFFRLAKLFYSFKILKLLVMIALVVFYHLSSYAQSQHFLSEMWTGSGGTGALFYKKSIGSDQNRNVYVAGSTING
jgi:hypothetical protein